MSNPQPTPRERELLILIHQFASENEDAPYPAQLVDDFGFDTRYILTLIGRLEKKGFLKRIDKRPILTERAIEYFSQENGFTQPFSVAPTQVRVYGTVTAGVTTDDVNVKLDPSIQETLVIPVTRLERKTYALRVVGKSMEQENIFEGDYVIVEEFTVNDGPRDNEMIVTKYYPLEIETDDKDIDVPETDFSDLTLKIFKRDIDEFDRVFYRLGWRKDNSSNPDEIKAGRVKPLGRVIGVYRNLRK